VEDTMSLTTILIILVILAVLFGGWGYTRRSRL
jgi:Sec-independent protein translocase protein TatA